MSVRFHANQLMSLTRTNREFTSLALLYFHPKLFKTGFCFTLPFSVLMTPLSATLHCTPEIEYFFSFCDLKLVGRLKNEPLDYLSGNKSQRDPVNLTTRAE